MTGVHIVVYSIWIIFFAHLNFGYSLHISKASASIPQNSDYFVYCKDESGRPVQWTSGRSIFTSKTNPKLDKGSYGTSLIFSNVQIADTGIYTCSAGNEKKELNLTVLPDYLLRQPPTRPYYNPKNNNYYTQSNYNYEGDRISNNKGGFNDRGSIRDNMSNREYLPNNRELSNREFNNRESYNRESNNRESNNRESDSRYNINNIREFNFNQGDRESLRNTEDSSYNNQDNSENEFDNNESNEEIYDQETPGRKNAYNRDNNVYPNNPYNNNAQFNNRDRSYNYNKNKPYPVGKDRIKFVETPTEHSARENENTTIRCMASGSDVSISWKDDNGSPLRQGKFVEIGDGLLVINSQKEDNGIYVCRATDHNTGEMKERRIRFSVFHKPVRKYEFLEKQEYAWGKLHKHANLTCDVSAHPPPIFQWFRGSHKLGNTSHFHIENEIYHSTLTVNINKKDLFDNYICKAYNDYGELETVFTLSEGFPPHRPEFEIINKKNVSVDVAVKKKEGFSGAPEIGYQLFYTVFTDNVTRDWQKSYFEANKENTYHLEGLKPNTTYKIKVRSENSIDFSHFSTTSIFQTTSAASPMLILTSVWKKLGILILILFNLL